MSTHEDGCAFSWSKLALKSAQMDLFKAVKKKKKAAFVERDEKSQEEITITISSDFYLQEII